MPGESGLSANDPIADVFRSERLIPIKPNRLCVCYAFATEEESVMKIDAIKLGFATAAVFAVAWVICSLFILGMPGSMMQMTGDMVHADLSQMGWQLDFTGFAFGLLAWSLGAGLIAVAIAATYNRLIG